MLAPSVKTRRLLWTAALMLLALSACKKKPKPFPPAPPLSSATTEGAALEAADAAPSPVPASLAAPSATPTPTDTLTPAERATLEDAKTTLGELETLVKRRAVTNPDRPADSDAATKCASLEESRPALEAIADTDAEAKKAVADVKRLCSLEVPILTIEQALAQLTLSPSQASRKLMCGFASKDLAKARGASPGDRRVRSLEARVARACR